MVSELRIEQLKQMKYELTKLLLLYRCALDEIETKINILKQEFQALHDYSPIEHTKSRIKTPESILEKMIRKNLDLSFSTIKENIKDIAGLRITCSFIPDIYNVQEMLMKQNDLEVLEIKDYIESPKPNGYRSLHMLVNVPVFMSDSVEKVCVEIQIRTIAMDFWASLEHKIFYKYRQTVPEQLLKELKNAAESAHSLDLQMGDLHREINEIKHMQGEDDFDIDIRKLVINNQQFLLPETLLELLGGKKENNTGNLNE
ncbi:putative GTP pyrophosphokinase [Fontibacillus panacisegetis]|uniref:Putative GTP pyrophosphokinase n=1 Tax=Fontibacillus panacisegetis TaxID=670482 RepID=A0A1G7ITZ7_9BACL|nr:GTP pyrophosphokinase family protein [Fontibacillus panacisegetis]SDF16151.1 putative GTP pyrophosphokinase [Fontibacillus panacisegetis]